MQNPAISVIADDETLSAFCERTLAIYPGSLVTLVIVGLEKYFRWALFLTLHMFRDMLIRTHVVLDFHVIVFFCLQRCQTHSNKTISKCSSGFQFLR